MREVTRDTESFYITASSECEASEYTPERCVKMLREVVSEFREVLEDRLEGQVLYCLKPTAYLGVIFPQGFKDEISGEYFPSDDPRPQYRVSLYLVAFVEASDAQESYLLVNRKLELPEVIPHVPSTCFSAGLGDACKLSEWLSNQLHGQLCFLEEPI
jgi:hypothetical protein